MKKGASENPPKLSVVSRVEFELLPPNLERQRETP
jgi:hypothetical protein